MAVALQQQDEEGGEAYVTVLVEQPDGEILQVEGKPSDKIRVLKVMIQLQIGADEDKQELIIEAETGSNVMLKDEQTLANCGIEEGTKLKLTIAEDAPDGDDPNEAPEGSTRIFVKCDISPGKMKLVTLYAGPNETGKEIKERAYAYFCKVQPVFQSTPKSDFGLFLPKTPVMDEIGNLRYLLRSEQIPEKAVGAADMGLSGDEELIFANLFFVSAF